MRIQVMSDLHLEHLSIYAAKHSIASMVDPNADVLVLAGNTCRLNQNYIYEQFSECANQIVYVTGNHEYYDTTFYRGRYAMLFILPEKYPNIHFLDTTRDVTIKGQHFIGNTLWFENLHNTKELWQSYTDDNFIKPTGTLVDNFEIIDTMNRNEKFFLGNNVTEDSIVITHYAPSIQCLDPKQRSFKRNQLCFTSCEDIIVDKSPKLWIHGHIHKPVNTYIDKTHVISNPRGHIQNEGRTFTPNFFITI